MTVTNRIAVNPLFLQCMDQNSKYEKDRKFCKHGWEHLMDVARIAYILNLERGYGLNRDQVYAAALLHDCGRYLELEQDIPHEKAGARLAKQILRECDELDVGEIYSESFQTPRIGQAIMNRLLKAAGHTVIHV